MSLNGLTIGKLASKAGVIVETIRYYQRVGLIKEPPRPFQGYRFYAPGTVDRVRFIKRAQELGFTLKEIAELLELGDGHCKDARQLAEQKYAQIQARITDLRAMRKTLENLIDACRSNQGDVKCAIVGSLTASGGPRHPQPNDNLRVGEFQRFETRSAKGRKDA